MKKTKVVIPALGIIAFATAASITGTVAWFTASRSVTITAGEFAVINTKDNLSVALTGRVGTAVNGEDDHRIDVTSGYKLTDGSVDPTNTTKPNIIAPDANGTLIEDVIAFDDASIATKLVRDDTNHIYTAFVWDMAFSVRFAGSQTKKLGLFLEPGNDTWMHEVVHFTEGEKVAADKVGTYYVNDPTCRSGSTQEFALNATITAEQAAKTYYKETPDDTGKAFSIAFIPYSIPTDSYGYTKIWAANREENKFIDFDIPAAAYDAEKSDYALGAEVLYNSTYYKALVANPTAGSIADTTKWGRVELKDHAVAYSNATTKMANNAWAAQEVGSGKVVMSDASLPAEGNKSSTTALTDCGNYMGYFGPSANNTVTLTYRCVAYYEGTDSNITAEASTIYETMTTSMKFSLVTLSD